MNNVESIKKLMEKYQTKKKCFSEIEQKEYFRLQQLLVVYNCIDLLNKMALGTIDFRSLMKFGGTDGIKKTLESIKISLEIDRELHPTDEFNDNIIVFDKALEKGLDKLQKLVKK